MSAEAAAGERLPYLIGKLEAPRIGERLGRIAGQARREEWPYERFLEALLEAEVFARDASGARQRIRSAGFPARKTLEDFDCPNVTGSGGGEHPSTLRLRRVRRRRG